MYHNVVGLMTGYPLCLLDSILHNVNAKSTIDKGFNRVMLAS